MSEASGPQISPPEVRHADELAWLSTLPGARPAGWQLTPEAVVAFICGSSGRELTAADGSTRTLRARFIGDRRLVERCVVTLAGPRSLLLLGEPGTAKSMLSELLATAICGRSDRTVHGSAGTDEAHLRYGWNYAMLIASGPSEQALVPSPVLAAMQAGQIARVEEITRCLSEVQDALVSILSERRMAVAELGQTLYAQQGFNLIATANTRDRGVSEMSAALKRRFNVEIVAPIARFDDELALVREQTAAELPPERPLDSADDAVLQALVTLFRDLRSGVSDEGWAVETPTAVMSAAEAVQVASGVLTTRQFFAHSVTAEALVGLLLGVVVKDVEDDRDRLVAYWDSVVSRRAQARPDSLWAQLFEARARLVA